MQILKVATIATHYQSAFVYARPGMGKTTLCGSLPGRTLIIDIDRGTNVLSMLPEAPNIDFCRLSEDLHDLPEILSYLEKKCEYDNVCIDSLSELEKAMLNVLARSGKNGGAPELAHYNQVQFKIADYVRRFRALPCNTVFTAWEAASEATASDGSKYQILRPSLSTKTSDLVCGLCDIVGRIVINPSDGERLVQLASTAFAVAKDRIFKRNFCNFADLLTPASKTAPEQPKSKTKKEDK